MNQIEELRSKIEAMSAELSESAAARRREAVQAELARQSPDAPAIVQRLAVAELGGADDVAGEVRQFLSSESVSPLLSQPAAEQKTHKGKRPGFKEMMSDFQNGNAQIRIR